MSRSPLDFPLDMAVLQSMLDALPVGALLVDTGGRPQLGNAALQRIWAGEPSQSGFHSRDEAGAWLQKCAESLLAAEGPLARALHEGQAVAETVVEIACRDGAHKTLSCQAVPLRDDMGAPRGAFVVMRNSSEAALSAQALVVQERERSRIAQELHERMGQELAALKFALEALQHPLADLPLAATAQHAAQLAQGLIDTVRDLAYGLRPSQLEHLGLAAALRWQLDQAARPTGVATVFSDNLAHRRFAPALELACFRIGQEAIYNAVRHANARKISLGLQMVQGVLTLSLQDDGIGFDPALVASGPRRADHGGLPGMEERAAALKGVLQINSSPGAGTEIVALFPDVEVT